MSNIQYKKISKFFRLQKFIFLCSLLDSNLTSREELFLLLKNNKIKSIKIKQSFFLNFIKKTNHCNNISFFIKGDLILLGFETFSKFLDFYDKRIRLISIVKILFSFQYKNLIPLNLLNIIKKKTFLFIKIYFYILI